MMKKQTNYIVHKIPGGYKAIIPSLDGTVFGENLGELEKGVAFSIEEDKKHLTI